MLPNTILQRTDKVQFSQLDDEMLAIDAQAGYCYSLNETAIKIWEMLAHPISLAALCERLKESYQVDSSICTRDTIELVEEWKEAGLVRICDEAIA